MTNLLFKHEPNNKMKVVILNPPAGKLRFSRDGRCQSEENAWIDTFPPTTLASIAGALRRKHNIKLIDCIGERLSANDCINIIEDFSPDFVITNTSTPTITGDIDFVKLVKEKTKSKIIAYGEHITACYKRILKKFTHIDYAILGDPETPILKILEGNYKVKGVATKDFNGGTWQELDLDSLPFPAYDLLPEYKYPLTGEKWMFIRSGRGCPYNCKYCVIPLLSNRKLRYHSADYMINQIKWLISDLDIKLYMFWDELSTLDKKRMLEFCNKMVEKGLNKRCKWFCTTRVDCFNEELAENMKKAGCRMVSFGIESGSQKVINKNNKKITIEQAEQAIKAAKKNRLKTIGHFIIGLPGSSPKSEKQTIKFAKHLKLNFAQFYIATPFPGSEFYKQAIKNEWIISRDWDKIEQGTAVISYPEFSNNEIKKWKNKAYRSFYIRPYAVYSLLSSSSFKTLIKLPYYSFRFFRWMRK